MSTSDYLLLVGAVMSAPYLGPIMGLTVGAVCVALSIYALKRGV